MSRRSSRQTKTQLSTQPYGDTLKEPTSKSTKTSISGANELVGQTRDTFETDGHSHSSAQPTDDSPGLVDENKSKENAAGERESSIGRPTKRHRAEDNEADTSGDNAPAAKLHKKSTNTQPSAARRHTTAANRSMTRASEVASAGTSASRGSGSKLHEEQEALETDDEMETDNNEEMEVDEEEHAKSHAYGYTGSDFGITDAHTSKSSMPSTTPNRRQMSPRVTQAPAESDDVWRLPNVVSDGRPSGNFTSIHQQSRRRAIPPPVREEVTYKHPPTLLSTYHSSGIDTHFSAVDSTSESLDRKHERSTKKLCNVLKYFATTCIVVAVITFIVLVSAVLIPVPVTDHSEFLTSIRFTWLQSTKSSDVNIRNTPTTWEEAFARLREEFPNQTRRLWSIMESATLAIMEEDQPTHPAVILLVAANGNQLVSECLARRYAALVTDSFKAPAAAAAVFNCETYAHSDPDVAKSRLDTQLSRSFDAGSKSGVVLRLEKLPGPAAMIFYRFAENDNAPYKDVAIILTLTLESTDTPSERDSVAFDELRRVWSSSLDADKIEPLLSRIGNSVAFVQPETAQVLAGSNC